LLEGHLTIADRFDRDGRRFVVVRASGAGERHALTLREREVLAAVALGHANKRIALELGVSESTVSAALRGAARKLGVRSRVELARILGPSRVTSRS
jgi:DNA-binding NarL/FixJ family response regulator